MSIRKDLTTMRTLCHPHGRNWLDDELDSAGVENVEIENLLDVDDGLYLLTACDFHTDWETGIIDDYSLKLVPFQPNVKPDPAKSDRPLKFLFTSEGGFGILVPR